MTLRVRFALWVSALLLAVLAAFGALVYLNLARGLAASMDDSLRLSASQAAAALNIENGRIDLSEGLPEGGSAASLRERGLTLRVLDPEGTVLQAFGPYRELPVAADTLTSARAGQSGFATLVDPSQGDRVRVYTVPILDTGQFLGVVQVAETLATIRDTLDRLLLSLLLGGPLLAAVAGIGGYFLAARSLSPIDEIARTARTISAEDLSSRLNLPLTNDEVGRLAATFDEMLARLDGAFRRERQFTADASHELRTPLAAMHAILSVMREQKRTPEEYEQALTDISEETDRLRGLVEDLLHLARGDLRRPMVPEEVDLSSLVNDVAESLRPLAVARDLTFTCDVPPGLTMRGDSDNLIRLFVNVLDNAIKYTERGSVALNARREPGGIAVSVVDTGPGIAPEHLPAIFDRFCRVEASRSSRGAGLGLAIALEIASAHGGTIDVTSLVGQGTTFIVHLPG